MVPLFYSYAYLSMHDPHGVSVKLKDNSTFVLFLYEVWSMFEYRYLKIQTKPYPVQNILLGWIKFILQ